MAERLPLVLGSAGQLEELPSGDTLPGLSGDVGAVFDGQGSAVAVNATATRVVTEACDIVSAAIESDGVSDSATVTVRKYSPSGGARGSATLMGTIALSSQDHNVDAVLGSWSTTSLAAGDIIEFEVTSAPTSASRLSVSLGRE